MKNLILEEDLSSHPLILGSCNKDSEEGEGYTIFKNTNDKIVEEIKKMNSSSDNWIEDNQMTGAKGQCKIEKKLNNTQFLCIDEHGHYFIKDSKSFKTTNRRGLLQKINDKFNVAEVLNETIAPLYTRDGYGTITFEKYDTFYKRLWGSDYDDEKMKSHMGNYDSHWRISAVTNGAYLDTYEGIILIEGEIKMSGMFCHLTEDGNIVNRDYNFDIKNFLTNKQKTREDLINEIIEHIPDVSYENYGNKWFSNQYAFILKRVESGETYDKHGIRGSVILNISKLEHKGGGKYGDNRSGKANKPKSTTIVPRDHLLAHIIPIINSMEFGTEANISKFVDMKVLDVERSIETPIKRVQKTKIKEKNYSEIFDWSTRDLLMEDIKKLDFERIEKSIIEFSNGIEIGENEDIILDFVEKALDTMELPSFSFDKGEVQEQHDDYIGLVKLPYGINLSFEVAEGDVCEISWAHSIYYTDVVNLKIIE